MRARVTRDEAGPPVEPYPIQVVKRANPSPHFTLLTGCPTARQSLRRASVRWVALGKPSERHPWAVAAGDLAVER